VDPVAPILERRVAAARWRKSSRARCRSRQAEAREAELAVKAPVTTQ